MCEHMPARVRACVCVYLHRCMSDLCAFSQKQIYENNEVCIY